MGKFFLFLIFLLSLLSFFLPSFSPSVRVVWLVGRRVGRWVGGVNKVHWS